MKTIAAILLLSCCAIGQDKAAVSAAEAACGPQDMRFEVKSDESQHPTPAPEAGKALLYVVQIRGMVASRFGVDGKWVGATTRSTYFFASIDPGEHHLCAMAQIGHGLGKAMRVSLRGLRAEAGITYYFVPHAYSGGPLSWFDLSQVDPDEGKYLVAAAKFSTSHPK
jgi:hypothetical protein